MMEPGRFTVASDDFEVAITVAIPASGFNSSQASVTGLGYPDEVPALTGLKHIALYSRKRHSPRGRSMMVGMKPPV